MELENTVDSVDSSSASSTIKEPVVEKRVEDTVSYETHKRLLSQRKADQSKVKDLEDRVSKFELRDKEKEEEGCIIL